MTEIRLIEDRLWICSDNGIGVADGSDFLALNELPMNSRVSHVIEDDRVTASYGEDDGIVSSAILSVCAAPDGDVILGSNGGGIYIIGKEGIRCVDMRSGLNSGVVMHIKYDPELDVFWLITGNAIAYMTTDYQVTTIQGFP